MTKNMPFRNGLTAAFVLLAVCTWPSVQGFNVGVKSTKCNIDPTKGDVNDPCGSLYDGICAGTHCACPPATHEDPGLKRCVPGEAPKKSSSGTQAAGGGAGFDPFDDLPFDYEPPGKKTTPKPSAPALPPPQRPPPQPQPPPPQSGYPGQPQPPPPHPPGYPGQPGYPPPPQPGYPGQPGYPPPPQPGYPGQPGQYPPGQYPPGQYPPQPGQPGYPGQYPPQPGQPGYPGQPGGSSRPTQKPGYKGGDNVGEKAGGGVGGVVGLLIIGGLIYFCCCRGGKGKDMMNRFGGGRFQGIPFIGGQRAAPGAAVAMQHSEPTQQDPNFGSQHTYIPPGGGDPNAGQYPPAQQTYPPLPAGFIPDGQQPPPYTQQYQPNAPPQ